MMGTVVTGRPVESAWLLHSEELGRSGYSHAQRHMENRVYCKKSHDLLKAGKYNGLTSF